MTERLYYADPYLRTFDATVRRLQRPEDRRDCLVVFLDRTAFYPTSGGQPFDTGTLSGFPVIDVVDVSDGSDGADLAESAGEGGTIAHVLDLSERRPLAEGQAVHGAVDWARRFDHMQQHTGQHVLSAAFDRLFGVRTLSFHLGAQASTIDLARETTGDEIGAAVREANRIVWEDRPVTIRFVTSDEAAGLPLRKEPARQGTLRLIDVEGFDLSACGGTHVARTGAIGVIAVTSWERFKGGQRLEFLCGGRALDRLNAWRDTVSSATRLLSVTAAELPAAIERMHRDARDQRHAAEALEIELSRYRADELIRAAEPTEVGRLVLRAVQTDAGGLKALANAVVSKPGHIAVLTSPTMPALVVVARSTDVAISAREVLSTLTGAFGGRGGGKAELAQGGGLDGSPEAILAAARRAIVSA